MLGARGYENYANPIKPEDLEIKAVLNSIHPSPHRSSTRFKIANAICRVVRQVLSSYREVAKRCATALPYTVLQEHAYG